MKKEMQKIIIRKAREDDLEQIRKLVEYLLAVEKAEDVSENTERIMRNNITPALRESEDNTLFVAARNGEIGGFSLLVIKSGLVASIAYIVVGQEYQRYGIGKKLMETMIGYAQEKKCEFVEALILKGNKKSKKFHKRMGFKPFSVVYRKQI